MPKGELFFEGNRKGLILLIFEKRIEQDKVHFTLTGQIGSNPWHYTAWRGLCFNEGASAEKWPDGRYRVYILGNREALPEGVSLAELKGIDEKMYQAVKTTAERKAQCFQTSVEDTATLERENQLVQTAFSSC